MANLSHIRSKADFIGTLNPKAWDAVHPHTPFVFSDSHVELLVADLVRQVAGALEDKALSEKTLGISRKMAQGATTGMLGSWEPGDEICPPWTWPWPGPNPGPWATSGPHPEPWQPVRLAEQVELAHVLTQLAGLTASKEFNKELKSMGTEIARGAASKLVDDFERCGTVPRKPIPPRPSR